jgi:hypothetical protein
VIIGFASYDIAQKRLYDYVDGKGEPVLSVVKNLNPYLVEGADLWIDKRRTPISSAQPMVYGSKPVDGGHLILSDAEKQELALRCPEAAPFIRRFMGSDEFLYEIARWCLWLADAAPNEWRNLEPVRSRVDAVREFRKASKKPKTREQAQQPTLFGELRQPSSAYLAVPEVSSEQRRYIPIGFLPREVIASNLLYTVPGASTFTFGIVSSGIHMAWMRFVAGRLESRYRYSSGLVYNNFPWPNTTAEQRERIGEKAQAVLSAREPHLPPRGMATLADLYDPLAMPPELLRAHNELDRAVEKCYRSESFHSDRERVEFLFSLYEKLTAPLLPVTPTTRRRRTAAHATTPRARKQRTPALPGQASPKLDL